MASLTDIIESSLKNNTYPILDEPYDAPEISGVDAMGTVIRDDAYKGKWIILYFYPKDLTPGCTQEAIDFQEYFDEISGLNAVILGVSRDQCAVHQKFMDKYGLRFNLISDESGDLCHRYGVWKEKSMYGKTYFGIERSTFLIHPKKMVMAKWSKVKVKNHAKEVVETLKQCQQSLRSSKS
jgi:thioredoxin-dependent peroxiredoxin